MGEGLRMFRRGTPNTTWQRLGLAFALFANLILVGLGLPLAQSARAATSTVCPAPGSGCNFTSIQAAVNAAAPGDTITVAAGTYTEQILVN